MLHVAIDARLPSGLAGGVRQVVSGLASGFSRSGAPVRRTWLVTRSHEWLSGLPAGDDVVVITSAFDELTFRVAERFPRLASGARPWVERLRGAPRAPFDDMLRTRGVDLVHFTFQDAFDTALPFIYQPHDLQHRHLPEYFSDAQIRHRESVWRTTALRAAAVSVGTRSVAQDVHAQWDVPLERVAVIPLAPHPESFEGHVGRREGRDVLLYPAAFWPHKNHELLVRAVARLRDEGLAVRTVLPGAPTTQYKVIRRQVDELGLQELVLTPGYIDRSELEKLYDRARVVAVPSRFESASFPIWEAMRRGIPAVASTVTALPRQLGDGGLLADPDDVDAWALAIRRLWTDPELWQRCSARGEERAARYTWEKTATAFASLYAHVVEGSGTPWHDTTFDASDLL